MQPFKKRAGKIRIVSAELKEEADSHAKLMAEEMGKPVRQGRAEIQKCAWVCDYYADHAEEFLKEEYIKTEASRSYICFEPLGIVLAIMPWNFPFWQVFRAVIPALMAGNAVLLKHASNVPRCADAIEKIFEFAGIAKGLFRNLKLPHDLIESVIKDPRVQGVTLTGSTEAGRNVASIAGRWLKKCVLELGGSDPYILLGDVHLENAAKLCVNARMVNTGQSCIAAKRFIVMKSQKEKFEKLMFQEMSKLKMGDPLDEATDVGPLARNDLREALHEQVKKSVELGARLLLGGHLLKSERPFYPPTLLTDVKQGMPVFDEETFGPVAAIISAESEEDALQLANSTPFGLGGAILSGNPQRAEKIARGRLEAGACFVNASVRSDPRLPFGGIKESGYGRELGSFGIREFVNVKTVHVELFLKSA